MFKKEHFALCDRVAEHLNDPALVKVMTHAVAAELTDTRTLDGLSFLRACLVADRINEINPARGAYAQADMGGDYVWLSLPGGEKAYVCGTAGGEWGGQRMLRNGIGEWEHDEEANAFDLGYGPDHHDPFEVAETILRAVQVTEEHGAYWAEDDEFILECSSCAFAGTQDEGIPCVGCGNGICWRCVDKYGLDASGAAKTGEWLCVRCTAAEKGRAA